MNILSFQKHFPSLVIYSLYSLSTLILAFTLSWYVLAKVDFLYPVWHDIGGIGEGIEKYGPRNKFKPGFGDTTKADRSRVFAEINQAVHQDGQGLKDISYETPSSRGVQKLLHHDEIVHLKDVAKLINTLEFFVWLNLFAWLGFIAWFTGRSKFLPSFQMQLKSIAAVFMICGVVLIVFGPKDVFNQLHIWIFPKEHKWFFFYQESLMSTLMLAPRLFGWIAAALAGLGLLFFISLSLFSSFMCKKLARAFR